MQSLLSEHKKADIQQPLPVHDLLRYLQCHQCHPREGVGQPSAATMGHFTSSGEDLGDEGRLPPHLNGVGRKLQPEALETILLGQGAVRPYLNTRMPNWGSQLGFLPRSCPELGRRRPDRAANPARWTRKRSRTQHVGTRFDGHQRFGMHSMSLPWRAPFSGHSGHGPEARNHPTAPRMVSRLPARSGRLSAWNPHACLLA